MNPTIFFCCFSVNEFRIGGPSHLLLKYNIRGICVFSPLFHSQNLWQGRGELGTCGNSLLGSFLDVLLDVGSLLALQLHLHRLVADTSQARVQVLDALNLTVVFDFFGSLLNLDLADVKFTEVLILHFLCLEKYPSLFVKGGRLNDLVDTA